MSEERVPSLYEQKERIYRLLDRGAWKHSWHLPKDQHGYINWWHDDTAKKVAEQKEAAIREAVALIVLAESIQVPVKEYDAEGYEVL